MKEKHTYHYFDESGELSDALRVNPYTVPAGYFDQLSDDITSGILALKLRENASETGFAVPEGYFGNLEKRLLERCDYIGDGTSPAMAVPPNYFEQLQADILAKVAEQQLKEHVKETGFAVPNGYFDTLEQRIAHRLPDGRATPIRRINQPRWMTYAAAACIAVAVGVVGFFQLNNQPNNDGQTVMTDHLATVSDQEILSYLELYGAGTDMVYIAEHLDDFGERHIGDGLSEEDIEAYLNNTL